jgi:hypothetical protein
VLSLGHAFFAQAKKGGSLATASETKDSEENLDTSPELKKSTSRSLAFGSG